MSVLQTSEINISELDPAVVNAVIQAHFETIRGLECGEKVGEWHYLSMRYYKGKGWANIARTQLEEEHVKKGLEKPTEDQVDNHARNIKYYVDTYRKKMGLNAA
jgi:hypothetical protein